MKVIVINNPAAKNGGALSILRGVLEKLSLLKCNRIFYVIASLEELKKYETENIRIIIIKPQGIKDRILWDNFLLKKFLKEKYINPAFFISLQNTGVNLDKKIFQVLYYHQAISVVDLKWNLLKKNERQYWLYKNIYPFFIKKNLDKVRKVIVQTEWIKKNFSEKFRYPLGSIIVTKPTLEEIDVNKIVKTSKVKYRIFYPAEPLIYKNHKIIIEALGELENSQKKEIECIFTFKKGDSFEIDNLISKYELEKNIKLIGRIEYEKVLEFYKSSDLLVFPSYLESLGLPLLEAKKFNMIILAADLEYSREILSDYKNVIFIKSFDKKMWKEKIWEKALKY